MPGKLISLLYVSKAIPAPDADDRVQAIVDVSIPRNASLDVTGALVFTGPHFAQVLEGPEEAVEELMVSIRRDARHRDVDVVESVEIPARRFTGWSLAYSGPSYFVDRHLRVLVEEQVKGQREAILADRLIYLMHEFVSFPHARPQ
jgi:hypothetical protein